MKFYPQNSVAHYTTKLAQPIELDGEYEVGLTEIIYPHSWVPLRNNSVDYWVELWWTEGNKPLFRCTLKFGVYKNAQEMLRDVNKQLKKHFTEVKYESLELGGLDSPLIRVAFFMDDMQFIVMRVENLPSTTELLISKELMHLLGYSQATGHGRIYMNLELAADEIFDINAGMRLMYIYCDVAAHSSVGDTQAPLLRVCDMEGQYGDTVRTSFVDTHYVPVQKRHFDTIEISINTEQGQLVPFQFGKSLVKLHFKRVNNFLSL
jgi:hypothetical protein